MSFYCKLGLLLHMHLVHAFIYWVAGSQAHALRMVTGPQLCVMHNMVVNVTAIASALCNM